MIQSLLITIHHRATYKMYIMTISDNSQNVGRQTFYFIYVFIILSSSRFITQYCRVYNKPVMCYFLFNLRYFLKETFLYVYYASMNEFLVIRNSWSIENINGNDGPVGEAFLWNWLRTCRNCELVEAFQRIDY